MWPINLIRVWTKCHGQKRAACSDEVPVVKKPRVLVKTVQKWMTERWVRLHGLSMRRLIATTWQRLSALCAFSSTRSYEACATTTLRLKLVWRTCERPATRIMLLCTCTSEQCFFRSSWDVTECAKALHNLGDAALKVKWEFDIAYLIAKHNLDFTKMGGSTVWARREEAWGGLGTGLQKWPCRHVLPLGDKVFIGFPRLWEVPGMQFILHVRLSEHDWYLSDQTYWCSDIQNNFKMLSGALLN